jgi:pyridoxal/pyridoxine/pyridoxamine kinase
MPIDLDTSEAPSFIRVTLRGAFPTLDQQRETRLRAISAGYLTAETRALFDFRELTTTANHPEVETMIAAAMKDGGWPLYRAYVVGSAVQFGLVRQMKALAPAVVELEVFTDEQEAQMWLWRNARKR